ncbi:response regulator transcription factor [Hyphomicrobium sp.]|uniref:response regulator transcription factor n=1 Tax=Hyphomicrobium sp. TaxID=82 RepID=UPI003F6F669A
MSKIVVAAERMFETTAPLAVSQLNTEASQSIVRVMDRTLVELTEGLRSAGDLDSFWSLAHAALERRGVKSMMYGAFATQNETKVVGYSRTMIWKSSHSQAFFDAFGTDQALDHDPSIDHCLTNPDIMLWHHDSDWNGAPAALKKRVSIERDLGLYVGVTVPTTRFSRIHIGGVGLSMPEIKICEFDRFWCDKAREIVTICGLIDTGMRNQHMSELVRLSPREKECLEWLAAGLRPDQIADRLAIGSKSIEKYIFGAKRKLRAATRDHAIAKALILGIIAP